MYYVIFILLQNFDLLIIMEIFPMFEVFVVTCRSDTITVLGSSKIISNSMRPCSLSFTRGTLGVMITNIVS